MTPAIIRATWLSAIVTAAAAICLIAVAMLKPASNLRPRPPFAPPFDPPAAGLPMDLILRVAAGSLAVLWVIVALLWVRVVCEFLIVIFQIAESLKSIDRKTKGP